MSPTLAAPSAVRGRVRKLPAALAALARGRAAGAAIGGLARAGGWRGSRGAALGWEAAAAEDAAAERALLALAETVRARVRPRRGRWRCAASSWWLTARRALLLIMQPAALGGRGLDRVRGDLWLRRRRASLGRRQAMGVSPGNPTTTINQIPGGRAVAGSCWAARADARRVGGVRSAQPQHLAHPAASPAFSRTPSYSRLRVSRLPG